jgi:4'-phosphopantetheinyl transferase
MTLLAGYNSWCSEDVKISYSRLNKPYLNPNPLDIQFNFSDTLPSPGDAGKGVALLAFTRSLAVGVDIEFLKRQSNFSAIVAKRFSQAETDYVTEQNRTINARRFLAYWTRKEAYGKAIGQGINFRMRDMDLASPDSFELPFTSADQPYRLQQVQIGEDLIAAIVHQGHEKVRIKAFGCQDLVR